MKQSKLTVSQNLNACTAATASRLLVKIFLFGVLKNEKIYSILRKIIATVMSDLNQLVSNMEPNQRIKQLVISGSNVSVDPNQPIMR